MDRRPDEPPPDYRPSVESAHVVLRASRNVTKTRPMRVLLLNVVLSKDPSERAETPSDQGFRVVGAAGIEPATSAV